VWDARLVVMGAEAWLLLLLLLLPLLLVLVGEHIPCEPARAATGNDRLPRGR